MRLTGEREAHAGLLEGPRGGLDGVLGRSSCRERRWGRKGNGPLIGGEEASGVGCVSADRWGQGGIEREGGRRAVLGRLMKLGLVVGR